MSEVKTDKISSVSTNGDITLDPDGTGDLIVASGNVGIGNTSPAAPLDVEGHIRVTGGSDCDIEFQSGSARRKFIGGDVNNLELGTYSSSNTSRDVHMVIDSGGNVGLNTTSPNSNALLHVAGTASSGGDMGGKGIMLSYGSGNSAPIYFGTETDASAKAMYMEGFYIVIRGHDNEGIKFNGSGSTPVTRYRFDMGNAGNDCFNASNSSSWNTTSDSRIKENVQTLPDGSIAKIKALRPVTFDYTDDWAAQKGWYNYTAADDDPHDLSTNGFNLNQKNNDIGWIAQEYATVFPQDVHDRTETVNGQEVTDFKTMKPDSLVPHLVKALQEAIAKIEALEARVTALEDA